MFLQLILCLCLVPAPVPGSWPPDSWTAGFGTCYRTCSCIPARHHCRQPFTLRKPRFHHHHRHGAAEQVTLRAAIRSKFDVEKCPVLVVSCTGQRKLQSYQAPRHRSVEAVISRGRDELCCQRDERGICLRRLAVWEHFAKVLSFVPPIDTLQESRARELMGTGVRQPSLHAIVQVDFAPHLHQRRQRRRTRLPWN